MKALKTILIICLLIPFPGNTQTSKVCIDTGQAKKVLTAAKMYTVCKEENTLLQYENDNLNRQISLLEAIKTQDSTTRTRQDKMISTYESKIIRVDAENATLLKENISMQTKGKRQKKRNLITTVISIVVSAIGTAIILK